jgi:thiamine-monophosphate kinase
MREQEVLKIIRAQVAKAGDDAASLLFRDTHLILTTDMLHRTSDFPQGATSRTIGWRSVAVSLSDLAAMGARPLGLLLALGDPHLEEETIRGVMEGAIACCRSVGTSLVGGDIDRLDELTLVSTGIGEAKRPVHRNGAQRGDLVCVTGVLGRTQAALSLFAAGELARANDFFCFLPRVDWGLKLAAHATSMIDISDGLAHSLHLLAHESRVGCSIEENLLPVIPDLARALHSSGSYSEARLTEVNLTEACLFGGEDYELLFTLPESATEAIDPTVHYTVIGRVTDGAVLIDGRELPDRGYEH